MSITQIDPKTALVVIDLQKGIASFSLAATLPPMQDVIDRAAALASAFRARSLPVVLVNVVGRPSGRTERASERVQLPADWADIVPELNQQPQDHLISKRTPGAFTSTDLENYLAARGITQIVLAGVSTSVGVEGTARQAFELGLNVTLAIDAMSDTSAEAHDNSVARIFPKIGQTGTTHDIIMHLDAKVTA